MQTSYPNPNSATIKVEEIRKRLNYCYTDKENSQSKTRLSKPNLTIEEPSKTAVSKQDCYFSDHRIKNIDIINRRIKGALGEKEDNYCQELNRENREKEEVKEAQMRIDSMNRINMFENTEEQNSIERYSFRRLNDRTEDYLGKNRYELKYEENDNSNNDPKLRSTVSIELNEVPLCIEEKLNKIRESTHQEYITQESKEQSKILTISFGKKEEKLFNIESFRRETEKLALVLSSQALIEQKLTDEKESFIEWNYFKKWELLHNKFCERFGKTLMFEIKNVFTLHPEEQNPFSQKSEPFTEHSIVKLLDHFEEANQFWKLKVRNSISLEKLEDENFSIQEIDLNKKGKIFIEDLVCFVNLQANKQYRNRDFVGLYRRLTGEGKVNEGMKYETFLETILM